MQRGAPGKRFQLGVGDGDLYRAGVAEFNRKAAIGLERTDELIVLRQAADGEIEHGRRLIELAARREHPGGRRAGFRTNLPGVNQKDAPLFAREPPCDGRADDAAAGDDDVVVRRHDRR